MRVPRDESAKDDTAVEIHAIENGVHNLTADVFEIDVDTFRSCRRELLFPVRMFVVDGGVEAEFVFNPPAFFIGTGDADNTAAVDLADLAGDTASCAGCARNDEGFAGLRFADVEEAEIGSEAVVAEGAEEVGIREKGNRREFL